MTDYVIPCDTVVRLATVLDNFHDEADDYFRTIRIDNGLAVASNRRIIVVENIGGPSGVFHMVADPTLIQHCRTEAPFSSKLTVNVNEVLRFAVAKTTLGYVHAANCGFWSPAPTVFDDWRKHVMVTKTPAKKSVGGMIWQADVVAQLGSASPSGRVIFEQNIDALNRPTVVRDPTDPDWFAVFHPYLDELSDVPAASLPNWMTL